MEVTNKSVVHNKCYKLVLVDTKIIPYLYNQLIYVEKLIFYMI